MEKILGRNKKCTNFHKKYIQLTFVADSMEVGRKSDRGRMWTGHSLSLPLRLLPVRPCQISPPFPVGII